MNPVVGELLATVINPPTVIAVPAVVGADTLVTFPARMSVANPMNPNGATIAGELGIWKSTFMQ